MSLSLVAGEESPANLDILRESFPDYARDIKLNLGTVLTPEGAPDLTINQIYGVAMASAYAKGFKPLIRALDSQSEGVLSAEEVKAAKAAANIMAMNNIYYRFVHLVGGDFKTMPAKLRMNIIGSPGIPKVDFELYSLAVSAINGCGMCMEAHVHEVQKGGISALGIQSAIRIAAVINASVQALN